MFEDVKYTKSGEIAAIVDGVRATIPDDMTNRHRVMLAEWVAGGGKIAPYTPPPALIPQKVSRFQARAALLMEGLLATVEAAISDADPLVQMAWADAQEFQRHSPTINAMATALGLSDEQVDDLFVKASEIIA